MSRSAVTSTISEVVTQDHRAIEECYSNYRTATSREKKEQCANQFRWELARHSVGEELIVYPAIEKYLGAEGKQIADADRADHLEVKKMMSELESIDDVNDPNFPALLKKLMEELSEHIKSEEQNDLAKLEKAMPREESESLAKSFQRCKHFVPTRSHPSAPDKGGLFETAAGLAMAPIDKLRDMFSSFPDQETV